MIGTEIGSFRFVEKIGEGGMGVVYRGLDIGLDREVAIKVLRPELASDSELVERFRTEARTQARLNHLNITILHAFVIAQGQCLIVMEFIDGNPFDELLFKRGKLPWQGAVSLTKQVLQGLSFAHARGVVHRDIKPANLMLTNDGIVKIMHFGIVKALGGSRKTRTGVQLGTPRYMPPEQILGRQIDGRSDIYSLGVTLYELLTGDTPFKADSDFALMREHVDSQPPSFTNLHTGIPSDLEGAVMKALAKDPAHRFQTADEFGAALERISRPLPDTPAKKAREEAEQDAIPPKTEPVAAEKGEEFTLHFAGTEYDSAPKKEKAAQRADEREDEREEIPPGGIKLYTESGLDPMRMIKIGLVAAVIVVLLVLLIWWFVIPNWNPNDQNAALNNVTRFHGFADQPLWIELGTAR
jgi:serine/threonine-protein kinase